MTVISTQMYSPKYYEIFDYSLKAVRRLSLQARVTSATLTDKMWTTSASGDSVAPMRLSYQFINSLGITPAQHNERIGALE